MLGRPSNIAYINGIKTVKNSNSSVATAKKKDSYDIVLKAKKQGTTKVTYKTKYGTGTLNVKVIKPKFDIKLSESVNGDLLITVKNNNKDVFNYVKFTITYKN